MDQPNLNMRQHRWLDLVKDYDCEILYHPWKDNIVVEALSRKMTSTHIRDICFRMVNTLPLLDLIKEALI